MQEIFNDPHKILGIAIIAGMAMAVLEILKYRFEKQDITESGDKITITKQWKEEDHYCEAYEKGDASAKCHMPCVKCENLLYYETL